MPAAWVKNGRPVRLSKDQLEQLQADFVPGEAVHEREEGCGDGARAEEQRVHQAETQTARVKVELGVALVA